MMYQVREICHDESQSFQAGCVDIGSGLRIAWIAYEPRSDVVQITCWEKPDVTLRDPKDANTTATLGRGTEPPPDKEEDHAGSKV